MHRAEDIATRLLGVPLAQQLSRDGKVAPHGWFGGTLLASLLERKI